MGYLEIRTVDDRLVLRHSGEMPHCRPRIGGEIRRNGRRTGLVVVDIDRLSHGGQEGLLVWVRRRGRWCRPLQTRVGSAGVAA